MHIGLAAVRPGDRCGRRDVRRARLRRRQLNDATQAAPSPARRSSRSPSPPRCEDGIGLKSRFGTATRRRPSQTADRQVQRVRTNYGGESYGKISLLQATEDSINTVYVDLSLQIGTDKVVDAARRAGIPEDAGTIDSGATRRRSAPPRRAPSTWPAPTRRSRRAGSAARRTPSGGQGRQRRHPVQGEDDGHAAFSARGRRRRRRLRAAAGRDATAPAPPRRRSAGRRPARPARRNAGQSAWFVGYTPQLAAAVDCSTRTERAPGRPRRGRRPAARSSAARTRRGSGRRS